MTETFYLVELFSLESLYGRNAYLPEGHWLVYTNKTNWEKRINPSFKETTGAFDGVWTHVKNPSTDYESDVSPPRNAATHMPLLTLAVSCFGVKQQQYVLH